MSFVLLILMLEACLVESNKDKAFTVASEPSTRKAKACLELYLSKDVKDNKGFFFKYVNSRRRSRENVCE